MRGVFTALLVVLVLVPAGAWAQVRADPEKVLAEEFGWTIQDLTKLSANKGFFMRNEPYQGFNCRERGRYLPKTDQERKTWKAGTYVCSTADRGQGENISAFMALHWLNPSAEKPLGREYILNRISQGMAGARAEEGTSQKIVETQEVDRVTVHLIEHSLPSSSWPFFGATLEFTHKGFWYFLWLGNATSPDKTNKKPWELAPEVARRIQFLE